MMDINSDFDLELGMQELESMEAPGFWTGVSIGVEITAAATLVASVLT